MANPTALNSTIKAQQNFFFVGVYSAIFLAGLILNLTALVIFFRISKPRSHTTMYMIHLAFADVLLVCTLPVRIYYHTGLGRLDQSLCEFSGLVLLCNMYGSIFLLMCISFDRCVAVCFPLSSRIRECRKKAWCVCLGIWILTIGASIPTYFRDNHSRNSTLCFGSFPTYATKTVAVSSTLIFGFGIPLTIMVVSSWGLIWAISKSTAAQNSDLVNSGRIKRMISTNLAIFLLCFMPYHVMLVLLHFYEEDSMAMIKAYRYSLMVACLNAVLDPLAYYFTTETFRRQMDVQTVPKTRPTNSHTSDGNIRSCVPFV